MKTSLFISISTKIFRPVGTIIMIIALSPLVIPRALASSSWIVGDRISVKGDGFWDHVTLQTEGHRLFVAHHDRLEVVDLLTRAEIASISGQNLCKACIVPALNCGFVTDGDAGNVIVFDLKTLKNKGTIKTDPDADAICYEPVTRRIFTFNGDSHSATVIDPVRAEVISTLPLDGSPESAEADGQGAIFVACCGDGTLTVIRQDSADSYAVEGIVETELGVHTMAFDSTTNTIYAPAAKLKPISSENPHPHPQPIPGTFHILVLTETTNP